MFDSFALRQDSFINSGKNFAAYERQQQLYNPPRIHEGFLIRTGPLEYSTWKEISFEGIPFDFRIMSIWIWRPIPNSQDAAEVKILYEGVSQVEFDLSSGSFPWEPPFNILGSSHSLHIRVDAANGDTEGGASIFIQPAKLLDVEMA